MPDSKHKTYHHHLLLFQAFANRHPLTPRLRNHITILIVTIMDQCPVLLFKTITDNNSSINTRHNSTHARCYPSTPNEPSYSVYSSSVPPKKKNTRASQTCDSCRQLKAKCDETKSCKTCKETGVECKYRDPVLKATDKAQADILEGLGSVQTSLNSIISHLGQFDQRSIKMESLLPKHIATSTLKTGSSVEDEHKRAPALPYVANGAPSQQPESPAPRPGQLDRSIHTALVLTVLALGKVCLHRDNVPDVVHHTETLPHGSPVVCDGVIPPRSNQHSHPRYSSSSHPPGLPPPRAEAGEKPDNCPPVRGVGVSDSSGRPKKNYEVTPGLEYFAYATDILGKQTGTYNNMKNVYANIFAGLYHGQLGRPMENFAFIHRASHKLQVILRPSLDKMRRIKRNSEFIQETKYNQLALKFWTCLQLEGDLIAEMQLPPSRLLSYEDDMPHPSMSLLEAPEDPAKSCKDKFKNVGVISDAVSGMHWVAPSFAFRADDPSADDIMAARLQEKCWGAQVITYRPFIRQLLQFSHSIKNHASTPNFPSVGSGFRQDITAPVIHSKNRTHGDIDPQVVELAKKGIKAFIESARAFHGLGDKRPIITTVFGTAHPQWGNLLILSAAFRDPILHTYVDEELLRTLFDKMVQFLRQSATATSALRTDMYILEKACRERFSSTIPGPTQASRAAPAHLATILQGLLPWLRRPRCLIQWVIKDIHDPCITIYR
ncbi:hypothetical protein F53441_1843 [Fusarium austroafricanum]|uniref:Zn(2)-C6 fungal-type domain-containing protein n=1 Tax=Fusarium austroafricanum TaxID=2364996 RepID=A0A8H4KTL6_9HYPO|nr:hypothetical protein F53441_1843 [Fusarium austroafricanum]